MYLPNTLSIARTIGSVGLLAALVLTSPRSAGQPAPSSEKSAACEPIEAYFRAHATGSASEILGAFLPNARVEGLRDGKLVSWSREEYAAFFKGSPPANEAQRKRTLESIDVEGTAGMARALLDNGGGVVIVDYFVLLRHDGKWKIASKVYSRLPR